VSGGYAYVASGGLQVIDISDPVSPKQVGFYDTVTLGLHVSGGYACVAEGSSLRVIDISDPNLPKEVGFCDTPIGVAVDTGELLWKHDHLVEYGSNISTPICHDGRVVLFRTFGHGATMLKLNVRDYTCTVEEVWHTEELDNEHGGVVLVDSCLYGHADGNHKWRHWACLELKTGKTMYSVEGLPSEGFWNANLR
jgi:hypothetical protein